MPRAEVEEAEEAIPACWTLQYLVGSWMTGERARGEPCVGRPTKSRPWPRLHRYMTALKSEPEN
jgi:hypothetical protein